MRKPNRNKVQIINIQQTNAREETTILIVSIVLHRESLLRYHRAKSLDVLFETKPFEADSLLLASTLRKADSAITRAMMYFL